MAGKIKGDSNMQNLLNGQKIKNSRVKINETELNTALNLAHHFTNERICNIKIKDVYDSSDILPFIESDINKPIKTEEHLKNILKFHINYLQEKNLLGQNKPLFPGYIGDSGKKKLQRHVRFSNYRDFNSLRKALRANQYKQLVQAGDNLESRMQKIAKSTGRSARTIARSLSNAPIMSSPSTKQSMKLKSHSSSLQASLSNQEDDDENKKDADIEKMLSDQFSRSQRITFTKDSPLEEKRKRIKYVKDQEKYNALKFPIRVRSKDILNHTVLHSHEATNNPPNSSAILQKASELIKLTALYCHEVTELSIGNVIKTEYHKDFINEIIQTDWIIDEIKPLPMEYPKGCNKLSVPLTNESKEVIRDEIELLQNTDRSYFEKFSVNMPLFPLRLSLLNYKKNPTKQFKASLQNRNMDILKRRLKKMKLLTARGYNHLREEVICQYCTGLIKNGLPKEDVIQLVQRFARYSNKKYAEQIINKIQTHSAQ